MNQPHITTVAIVDDDRLVRLGLRAMIDAEPDLHVIGEASDGSDGLQMISATRPDVVIMDVRMPGMDGIQATKLLMARPVVEGEHRTRVLVATTFEFDDYVYDALAAGASGFVLKRVDPDELMDAIRVVSRGESLVFPALTRRLIERFAMQRLRTDDPRILMLSTLTDREAEILRLIAAGQSNQEMAEALFLSLHTIKTHVGAVLTKIDARDRTQAVVFAYETGFVTPGR